MSWELASCLKHCGLEERWLKILKNTEIETVETLVTRINDGDLYDVLESAAEDEEKEALMLLTSQVKKMSWELPACLQYCGLEEKWLKILKNLEIETFESLKAKTNDGNLYDVLEKAAKDEEKEALKQLLSKDCGDHIESMRSFAKYLEENGLNSSSWRKTFIDEGIWNLEDLRRVGGHLEKFDKLTQDMNDVEALAVREMMGIAPEVAVEYGVKSLLNKIGLDCKYWFSIFRDELHISHPLLLKYITSLDCQILLSKARHENEASIIKQQFRKEGDLTFSKIRQRDREKSCSHYTEIQNCILELQELHAERQKEADEKQSKSAERNDKFEDLNIQLREENLGIILQVPRTEFTELCTNPEDALEILKQQIQDMNFKNLLDGDFSDGQILEKTSDGLALKGLLFKKNCELNLIPRKVLLRLPSEFSLSDATMQHCNFMVNFSSLESQEHFSESIKHYGYSIAVAERVQNDAENKMTTGLNSDQLCGKPSDFVLVRYVIIPVACGNLDFDGLLSEDALQELKTIEAVIEELPEDLLLKKCEEFFSEYGSHFSTGRVHFGGICELKVKYTGNLQENSQVLQRVAEDALDELIKLRWNITKGASITSCDLSESFKQRYSKFDQENLILTVETLGGPTCSLSFLQWKLGLVGANSSWVVIDRGFHVKGIWELVENHQNCFDNYGALAGILCFAWEKLTGLRGGQLPNFKHLVEIPSRVHDLCKFVEKWTADTSLPKYCENILEYINNEKDELTVISRSPSLWSDIAKENPCILSFLDLVAQNKDKYLERNIFSISFLFQQLAEGLAYNNFMNKEAILKWMTLSVSPSSGQISKSVAVLLNFISLVKKFVSPMLVVHGKSKFQNDQSSIDGHCICATNDLAFFVSDVLDKLHSMGDHHIAYLLTILLFDLGYTRNSRSFDTWLSVNKLDLFLKNLEEKKKYFLKYRDQGVIKVECYVLHVALEVAKDCKVVSNTVKKICQLMDCMKSDFSLQVNQIIDKYGGHLGQWNVLESFVQSVLYGTTQENDTEDLLGKGLEKVMQIPPVLSPDVCETTLMHLITLNIHKDKERKGTESSILEMLGLTDYFPSKITLQHVMRAEPDRLDTVKDIPWYVLQKLLMLDYRGRNVSSLPCKMIQESQIEPNEQCDETVDDFVNDIFATFDSVADVNRLHIPHPSDVLVAIFLCSSNFLRQVLAEKMYMCHVSIPLLLPDVETDKLTYLLWVLRTVTCEYELPDGRAFDASVLSHDLPIVSFLRLGEVARSKSKLLNDIISDQSHNTFFHRDCASGTLCPKIANGMADVAWYLPSKRVKSKVHEAVTYINLHGDGKCFPVQRSFLINASTVVVMLLSIEELENSDTISVVKDIVTSKRKLILVVSKNSNSTNEHFKQLLAKWFKEVGQELKKQTVILDFNSTGPKNASEISNEIMSSICNALENGERSNLLKCKAIAEGLGIIVDENDAECVSGLVFAKEVFSNIDSSNLINAKSEMLPLQGDLWHRWAILDKKEHRREGRAQSEHYVAELHEKKKVLRRKQLSICHNPPRLLEAFISKLLCLQGPMKLYFLKWLMIYLDETSRKALPSLIRDYRVKWTEINQYKSKQKSEADPYMMALLDELCKIEENLAMTSLGLEHIMREVGQAFEAVASLPNQVTHGLRDNIYKLPRVMAELMLTGHPLEIMDGDASHVPLSWVTAVLSELKVMIGDKKVFVLSVLGVQSSGKSTLLNTMFGLQFAVSAGRCTRGVYAQLVPIPKVEGNVSCDYILVVDTEGLRAPELGSVKHQHDNELATLVIGLGDMCIVNIKGENPSEMQDVLQIVVHAFLRMQLVNKNLKLQPSCFFIHQNVGAVNAAGKLIFGQQKLQENLDQMTVAAADQENVRGIYSFKEVIDFDVEKNVWYFSDLWQGDPPMAPTNPGYSEKVSELKISLFKEILQKKSPSSLSSICIRIKDIWKGILAENFVFSFKNSLELKAYGSLESTLTDLSWALQNNALKWLNDVRNRIKSTENDIDALERNLSCEFSTFFLEVFDEAHEKLCSFFEKSDDKEILEQWKEKSIIKLKDKKDEIVKMTMTSLKNETELRKAELQQLNKSEEYREEIQILAKKLAVDLQGKENLAEGDIEKKFNQMWDMWMENLSPQQNDHNHCDVKSEVSCKLLERLSTCSTLLREELKEVDLGDPVLRLQGNFIIVKDHISTKKRLFFFDILSNGECLNKAFELLKSLFDDIEEYINGLQGLNFNPTQAEMVIKKTCDMTERVNCSEFPFKFTTLFKVQVVVFVCRYAVFRFEKLQNDYLKEIDPKIGVEKNYKEQLLQLFKSKYTENKNEVHVAEMLSACLMDAVNKAVLGDMSRELADDVRSNVPVLHTKGELLKSVLKDLLKSNSFEAYQLYLTDIKACLRLWVKLYTDDYVFDKERNGISRYAELAFLKIQSHFHYVTKEIEKATNCEYEHINEQSGMCEKLDFQQWMKIFHEGIKGKLPLPESNLSLVSNELIEDIEFFKESLLKSLSCVQKKLENNATLVNEEVLNSQNNSVYSLLEKECLGCCEQCPFCRAPCSLTISGHEVQHSALQHYPQGAGRFKNKEDRKLVIDNCSSLVCSDLVFRNADTNGRWHPYEKYHEMYPNWKIQGDASMESSLHWKWFMANFAPQLAAAYKAEIPDIPHAWTVITPSEAESSLD